MPADTRRQRRIRPPSLFRSRTFIMKTGILIHGCNLHIENWRHVAWGDPPHRTGRIVQGMLVAALHDPEVIVMGTGASQEPFHFSEHPEEEHPLPEAEYSLRYLRQFFDDLGRFEPVRRILADRADPSVASLRPLLDRIQLDTRSRNTTEEIENASAVFLQRDVEQVILVSSPSHVVRCLRDAAHLYFRDPRFESFRCHLMASPSITCYEGSTPGDVVVVEPPHRPDRHVLPTHRRIQRMLELQKMPGGDVVSLIEDFDQLLQRYEHRHYQLGNPS